MTTSFIINLEDLNRILENIKIAEAHAAGTNLVDAINQVAGPGNAASIVPFGLRTVDGSLNHLLPGDTLIGAADQLFPRLLTQDYRNLEPSANLQQGDVMPFGPPGGPAVYNNNYDPALSGSPNTVIPGVISAFDVADADPRIISNLIVDQTEKNPAAVASALLLAGSTNPNLALNAANTARIARERQATETAYEGAVASGTSVDGQVQATLNALNALFGGISVGDVYDAGDAGNATDAVAAIDLAVAAQQTVITALESDGHVAPAHVAAANGLLTSLLTLQTNVHNAAAPVIEGNIVLSTEVIDIAAAAFETLTDLGTASGNLGVLTTAEAAAETASNTADAARNTAATNLANEIANLGLVPSSDGSLTIENQSADIGLSPANSGWMTLFGQFFDHGLDLVTKGGNGTVYIPLQPDDPNYDPLHPETNFMALTRATVFPVTHPDGSVTYETENTTTPFVDQNQTYTSHASHQVFLREYATVGGKTVSTGHLLNNENGGIGTWADVKAQALNLLGIKLNDYDIDNVPLLLTDPYGKFIPDPVTGYAQVVTAVDANGNPTAWVSGTPASPVDLATAAALRTGHAFLNDIAHHAAPGLADLDHNGTKEWKKVADADFDANGDGVYDISDFTGSGIVDTDNDGTITAADLTDTNGDTTVDLRDLSGALVSSLVGDTNHDTVVDGRDFDRNNDGVIDTLDFDINGDGSVNAKDLVADDHNSATYDNEMLDSHFITGDGRGNENIGLTAVHFIFHAEHDRAVEADKLTVLRSGDINVIKEWLLDHNTSALPGTFPGVDASDAALKAYADTLTWDGERLFQAARFTTEMQYQHMVFEEFARRVQPNVDPFVFTNSADIDPSIVAEFAHVVYRFGHSMLTDSVDRLQNDLTTVNGDSDQIRLVDAFLNPQAFTSSGDGVVDASSDIDAATNIIRGMSQQVGNEIDEFVVNSLRNFLVGLPLDLPALNIARGRDTGVPGLNDARAQLYAASGHIDVKPYTSWLDFAQHMKHPISLINFIAAYGAHDSITSATTIEEKRDAAIALVLGGSGSPSDRTDFLNATGAYAGGSLGGLNDVDLWIGGLAEEINEFGGQLGSTFNFVFEYQMEQLQNGDRFYYLSRTQGMNLLNILEANTFSDIIMRNTNLGSDLHATHMSAEIMEVPDMVLELDLLAAQHNYSGDSGNDNLTTSTNEADRAALDPTHGDMLLDIIDPKVVREYGVDDGNGGTYNLLKFSGGEHVVLGGTEENDRMFGDKGIDTLWGDGGDDYLNAGMESDQVFGGDGDDIIEDPFGDDFLRGEAGDDVVVSGAGIDVLFGGTGNDFVQIVTDTSEIFAGPGDDFLLGGSAPDALLGNEGDDWIEGGEGFDSLSGENSELFFNSPIVGHDILWGQANDTDYDGENGDDIMVQGSGIQRSNGMDGFDWAIHKGDTKADGTATDAFSDMTNLLGAGAVNPAFILRDRFDSVEGLSGWDGNDKLLGASLLVVAGGGFNSSLTQEGVDRVNGLKYVLGTAGDGVDPTAANAADAVVLTSDHAFNGGEIILGGAGSDIVMGALGDDILDGDAWLNVRISVHQDKVPAGVNNHDIAGSNPEIFTVNSLTETITGAGAPYDGKSLADLMRTGLVNPGQLKAVREVLNSDGSLVDAGGSTNDGIVVSGEFVGDVDIAAFRYARSEYIIEGADSNNDNVISGTEIQDTDNDGFIRVEHVPVGQGGGALRNADGIDHIRNFEILEFADGIEIIQDGISNNAATGAPSITINNGPNAFNLDGRLEAGDTLVAGIGTIADADNPGGVVNPASVTFTWQQSITDDTGALLGWEDVVNPVTEEVITGTTFTPTAAFLLDGLQLRVVASFRDANGIPEFRISAPTDPLVGTAPVGPDPAAVLGLTSAADPNPADGVVVGALLDLTGTIDPAGDAVPQAVDVNNVNIPTFGIFEDGGPFTITKDRLLQFVGDIDTPNSALVVSNLAIRIRPGDPDPGTLVNNNDGTWTYTPAVNFNGGLTFNFDVSDGTTTTPLEAVLDVLAVNDAPPNPNNLLAATTPAGIGATSETFTLAELLANIPTDGAGNLVDADGDIVTLVAGSVSSTAGTVTDNGDDTFTWTPNPGSVFNVNTDIIIDFQLDDGTGSANAIANATARIDTVNVSATGSVTINDTTPAEGQVLTATRVNIADINGVGVQAFQWQSSSDNGATWTNIAGATAATFAPGGAQVGQQLRAVTLFTDQGGSPESIFSAATAAVTPNNPATGRPVISEAAIQPVTDPITPREGEQLSAATNLINDADGIQPGTFTFQWQSSLDGTTWANIAGATSATFTPQDLAGSLLGAQAGRLLRVQTSFLDGFGKTETVTSLATAATGANWNATPFIGNTFNGAAGDDIAVGTSGVLGVGANDTLNGNAGNDRLSGAGGNDTLNGGADNDTLAGNAGNDTVNGGTGSDTITWNAGDGRDFVDGGTTAIVSGLDTSSDTFIINGDGSAEAFRIYTRAQAVALGVVTNAQINANTEIVITRNGTTVASVIAELDNIEEIIINGFDTTANDGNGVVNSGTASGDTISVIGNFTPPNTSLNFSTITINGSGNGDIVDISQLTSAHRIVFNTNGGGDQVVGALRPQDVVNGAIAYANVATNNADVFYGLSGNFNFAGLKGNDVYIIDAGDTVKEAVGGGTDEIRSADINVDLSKFANVENATLLGDQALSASGTSRANKLDGEQNSAGNVLKGLWGNDCYLIGAGDSIVEVRNGGTDTAKSHSIDIDLSSFAYVENAALLGAADLEIEGNDGNNVLAGNDGKNEMKGGKGNDSLDGGLGDDSMDGGAGNDVLNVSLGNDTIVIRAGFGNDRVIGFDADAAGGQDKIDISALGLTEATFGGHVTIIDAGLHTLVKIDSSTLKLDGVRDHTSVTMEDFVLFGV